MSRNKRYAVDGVLMVRFEWARFHSWRGCAARDLQMTDRPLMNGAYYLYLFAGVLLWCMDLWYWSPALPSSINCASLGVALRIPQTIDDHGGACTLLFLRLGLGQQQRQGSGIKGLDNILYYWVLTGHGDTWRPAPGRIWKRRCNDTPSGARSCSP